MTRSPRLLAVLLSCLLTILLLPIAASAAVPDAQDDTATVAEDSGATAIDVLDDDSTDAGTLVITGKTNGAHGTVTFDADSVTYTPAANYSGPDTFTYTVTNDDGPSTASVDVTVTPVNDPPVAHAETIVNPEDVAFPLIDVQLMDNDTDIDDIPGNLRVQVVSQPDHGTLTPTGGSHWTYTPDADWNVGQAAVLDTFQYRVTDGEDVSNTVTGSIYDFLVNDPPSFTSDGDVSVDEDSGPASFSGWVNTFDDGAPDEQAFDTIHFTIALGAGESSLFTTQPAIATQRTANQGRLTFTPAANAHGVAHVTVTPVDDGGTVVVDGDTFGDPTGDPQTFTISIDSDNDPPHADDDSLTIAEDAAAAAVNVLAGDTDPEDDDLTITAVTQGAKGSVVITGGGTGVTYEPDANANGADTFTYTVSDGNGGTDTGLVHVTITAVNDKPDAANDAKTLDEDDGTTAIAVLGNDDDIDGNALTVTAVTQGGKGSVAITGGGTGLTYTPDPNANGADTFSYTISDGHGMGDTADVSITIDPVNDAPIAPDDAATLDEDAGPTPIDVLDDDTDLDGDDLTITDTTDGASGVVAITGGGSGLTYRPNDQFHGTDTFTYTVSDGTASRTATVTVTVTSVNDKPVADDDDFGVDEDAAATPLAVLAGDTDLDLDTLTIISVTQGSKGAVLITGGGTGLTYRPFSNLSGMDSFTYTISDGHGQTDTATVTMTIGGENDPPNAVNDLGLHVREGAGATALDILANDDDPDGNDLTIVSVTSAAHGTVTITGNGTGLAYRPAKWFHGTDQFTYTVDDGHGDTDHATVQVVVDKDVAGPVSVAPVQRFPGQTLGTSSARVRMSWSASDPGSGVTRYLLQVSVNGGTFKTVALAKATTTTIDQTLAYGRTYRFRVKAYDHEGNVGAYAYGPTFRLGRYEETNHAITYVGAWSTVKRTAATSGAARYTGSGNRSATLDTVATDIALVVTRTPGSGRAQVYLDGNLVATVNLARSSVAYRQVIYARHFATLEPIPSRSGPSGTGASSSTPSWPCADRPKVAARSRTDRTMLLLYCARLVRSPMIEPGRGWAYVALFSQIGISLLVTTLLGVLVGRWVDGQLGTLPDLLDRRLLRRRRCRDGRDHQAGEPVPGNDGVVGRP